MKSFIARSRTAVIVGAALSMMLAALFVAPPSADAQPFVSFQRDLFIAEAAAAGIPCTPIGTITEDAGSNFNGEYCRPDGFTPVTDNADCVFAANFFGVNYLFDGPTGTCFIGFYAGNGVSCEAPAVFLDGTCLLYTSPSPRDATLSRMPSSA